MAECAKRVYHPRRPRETVCKYFGFGDLKQVFVRVRWRDCGHEYLLALSCKGRHFCTRCHTKRAVAFAEWLQSTVLWPVAHRQIVLTIAKMPRVYFRYDRRLLGELCRIAVGVIAESFRVRLGQPAAKPGAGFPCRPHLPYSESRRAPGAVLRMAFQCAAWSPAKIFAADPLAFPHCRGPMRIVALIEEPRVVRTILEHLLLWDAQRPRPQPVAEVEPADCEYVPCED